LFVSFRIDFLILNSHSDLIVETIENGISLFQDPFYLCLESLGLDITSVIFRFQKWRQHAPFCDFFLSKNHTNNWFLHDTLFHRKSFTNSNKLSFWISKLLESDSFNLYIENILTKFVTTYWLVLTLDPCPCEMNKYFLLKLHHVLFTLHPNKKREF
jgi:hypothetical protein